MVPEESMYPELRENCFVESPSELLKVAYEPSVGISQKSPLVVVTHIRPMASLMKWQMPILGRRVAESVSLTGS